jgi:PIN domain nuclease of toxin-antitoxin system
MILLDTHALVWLLSDHRRARRIPPRTRLYASPVSLLELRLLEEVGRIQLKKPIQSIHEDDRLDVDDPSALALFEAAAALPWTRDPYDRLIVGHARMRGWRLATADARILENLPPAEVLEL